MYTKEDFCQSKKLTEKEKNVSFYIYINRKLSNLHTKLKRE